jgi:ABC-type proline/glycine betaine transport system ATPase subunit
VLVGEQGTGKSTTLNVLKRLIDPGKAAARGTRRTCGI